MAIPGVHTAVKANIRKNPVAPHKSGDGGTSTPTVRTRASEAVRTASAPASAESGKRTQEKQTMAYHYGYNDGKKAAGGTSTGRVKAKRPDQYQYSTPTKVNYKTFQPGLAGNAWNKMTQTNPYGALNSLGGGMMMPGMNMNATMGAQLGLGIAKMLFGGGAQQTGAASGLGNIGGSQNVYERANAAAAGTPKLSTTVPAGGGTPLENMKGAGDSASLQSAITVAREEQSSVTSKLQTLKGEIINLENDKNAAEQKLEQLDKDIKAQKEVVDKKQDAVKTAEGQVKEAKHSQESAKKGLEQAETQLKNADDAFKHSQIGVENAQTALSGAQTRLSSANARLAATPPTLADGSPNPAYAQAKSDVAQAENDVAQKKKDLTAAQELRDQKAAEYKQANSDKTDAAAQLDRSISQLKHAEKQQAAAEDAVVQAKKDLETEEGKLEALKEEKDSAEGAIRKYDEAVKEQEKLEKQVADYEREIPKQEQRLKKLQAKEDKEFKSLDGDISKTQKEVDDLRAKGKTEKADEKQAKLDGLNARKTELQDIINQRNFKTEMGSNGQVLKSGFINGEQVFMVGDKKVSAQEFDAAKKPVITSDFNPNAQIPNSPPDLSSMAPRPQMPTKINVPNQAPAPQAAADRPATSNLDPTAPIEERPIDLSSMAPRPQAPTKIDVPNQATAPAPKSTETPVTAEVKTPQAGWQESSSIGQTSYSGHVDNDGKFTGHIGNKDYTSYAEYEKDLSNLRKQRDDYWANLPGGRRTSAPQQKSTIGEAPDSDRTRLEIFSKVNVAGKNFKIAGKLYTTDGKGGFTDQQGNHITQKELEKLCQN